MFPLPGSTCRVGQALELVHHGLPSPSPRNIGSWLLATFESAAHCESGSTCGWEALATQVWYPDFFGGAWPWCPDLVDFHYYQIVNIYKDENAYYRTVGWGDIHEGENGWGLKV